MEVNDRKFGDTREDGYRFVSYEKRLRRLSRKKLAEAVDRYVAGGSSRDALIKASADAIAGEYYYREKWCSPERFKKLQPKKKGIQ